MGHQFLAVFKATLVLLLVLTTHIGYATDEIRYAKGINLNLALDTIKIWQINPTPKDLANIMSAGFNAIRLPILTLPHSAPESGEINNEYLRRLDEITTTILSMGFMLVIDIHDPEFSYIQPEDAAPRLASAWAQITRKLIRHRGRIYFEILNEPHEKLNKTVWNRTQTTVIKTIRDIDRERKILINGGDWSSVYALNSVKPQMRNLIGNFHYYSPMSFTHQGAYWSQYSNIRDRSWDATPIDLYRVINDLDWASKWIDRWGISTVVTEFGVIPLAPKSSRRFWIETIRDQLENRRIGWFYWSYLGDFGIFSPADQCWDEVITALIPQPPTNINICDSR